MTNLTIHIGGASKAATGAIFIGRGDVRFEGRVNWLTGVVEVREAVAKI